MVKRVPSRADPVEPARRGGVGGHVGEVEQRDVDGGLDRVGHLVHRVGAEHHALGAGRLKRPRLGASSSPAAAQSPAACIASTSAKSTEASTSRAEWKPPSRSRTASLTRR